MKSHLHGSCNFANNNSFVLTCAFHILHLKFRWLRTKSFHRNGHSWLKSRKTHYHCIFLIFETKILLKYLEFRPIGISTFIFWHETLHVCFRFQTKNSRDGRKNIPDAGKSARYAIKIVFWDTLLLYACVCMIRRLVWEHHCLSSILVITIRIVI